MRLDAFIERLCAIRDAHPQAHSLEVVVVLQSQGTLGATPSVDITGAQAGFDWDNGRVQLFTARPVVDLTAEQVKDIQTSVRKGGSWHAYQHHKDMQAVIDRLKTKVIDLGGQP